MIQEIVTGIKTSIEEILPIDYKELSHTYTLTSNNFSSNPKRFGVVINDVSEVSGTTNAVTLTQSFSFYLTEGYYTEHLSDDIIQEKLALLYDYSRNIVKNGYKNKFYYSEGIININNTKTKTPIIENDYNLILLETEVFITYRDLF